MDATNLHLRHSSLIPPTSPPTHFTPLFHSSSSPPQVALHRRRLRHFTLRAAADGDSNINSDNRVGDGGPVPRLMKPPPPPETTVEIRFRRGSRKRRQQTREGGGGDGMMKKAQAEPPKQWEEMTLSEKAVELYVGEKGMLFWLNKLAYASIYVVIGAWILFRFVGPSLNLYQLDSDAPLSPTAIFKS